MLEPRIIDRGRGPEIEGTRITVYDVLDYYKHGWDRDMIADLFDLDSDEVDLAIRYIDEHQDEVMPVYEKMLERDARGNPPELQAKIDAGRIDLHALARACREARERREAGIDVGPLDVRALAQQFRVGWDREAVDAGHSGGRQHRQTPQGNPEDLDF
jgi:uncharacterized protein (DUF433 family)